MSPTIETLRSNEDDFALSMLSFGNVEARIFDPDRPLCALDRTHCVYDGDRLVAKSRSYAMGQFFGGRRVPMGGLSGVGVAPTERGRGLARAVVTASLRGMHERGEVISSQFPTTAALYRSLGYEFAAEHGSTYIPIGEMPRWADLDTAARAVRFEPCVWDDVIAEAPVLMRSMAQPQNGWQDSDELLWRQVPYEWAKHAGGKHLVRGVVDGKTVAIVGYQHENEESSGMFSIWLEVFLVADGSALAAALAFLGAHGTTADTIKTTLPLEYFGWALPAGEKLGRSKSYRVMTRLIDAPGAIAARGYPAGLRASVALTIDDPLFADNRGSFVLEVAGGQGQLVPGGAGGGRVGIGALSSIYCGATNPFVAAGRGAIDGADDTQLAALQAMFAGERPSFTEYF